MQAWPNSSSNTSPQVDRKAPSKGPRRKVHAQLVISQTMGCRALPRPARRARTGGHRSKRGAKHSPDHLDVNPVPTRPLSPHPFASKTAVLPTAIGPRTTPRSHPRCREALVRKGESPRAHQTTALNNSTKSAIKRENGAHLRPRPQTSPGSRVASSWCRAWPVQRPRSLE